MQISKTEKIGDYVLAIACYLLINFVVFHGGIYRYLCEPESYAGNVYGRMEVLREIERETNSKVVAFLGDSITEEGIDASEFATQTGKPTSNLALPGTSPFDWSFFLRAVDAEGNRFDSIILTVIPQTEQIQAHEDGIQTLLPVASIPLMIEYLSSRGKAWHHREDYYAAFDRIFAFRRDLRGLILDPQRLRNASKERKDHLEKIRNYAGQPFDVCGVRINPKNGRIIAWGDVRDEEIRRLTRHNINRVSKLNRNPEVSGITSTLKIVAQRYKDSETQIIVVSIPFGPGHRISANSRQIERYLNDLETLKKQYNVNHWTAFEEEFLHDCSHFFDYRHLNRKGRPIFTKWLVHEFSGLLMTTSKTWDRSK